MTRETGAIGSRALGLAAGLLLALFLLAQGITREVPIGGLEGTVVMAENGKPLPNAEVILRPDKKLDYEVLQRMPAEDRPRSYAVETDANGRYRFHGVRAGDYEIDSYGEAHGIDPVKVTVAEGKPSRLDLELKPHAPFLDLYANQHVFRPDEKIELQVHGFVDADEMRIAAYKLKVEGIAAEGSLYRALSPLARLTEPQVASMLGEASLAAQTQAPITQRTFEGTFKEFFGVPALSEGLYWVVCSAGGVTKGTYFSVSRIAMITKSAGRRALCFVTDLASGEPVQGATILALKDGEMQPVTWTDGDGLARVALEAPANSSRLALVAKSGESHAMVDFWTGTQRGANGTRIAMYSDRPIYRPGDEVNFKGIVRKLDGVEYAVPSQGAVDIEVRDEDDSVITQMQRTLTPMGTFAGSFSTNRESPPGTYRITAKFGGSEGAESVWIAAYRKPEYSITVEPEKPFYIRGERARVAVDARYYFGSPVAGAKISADVYRTPDWSYVGVDPEDVEEFEDYEYGNGGGRYGGQWIETIKTETDENGRAILDFATDFGDAWDDRADSRFSVTVSVTDGDKYFSGEGSVRVAQAAIGIAAEPSSWVADVGKPVEFRVRAFDQGDESSESGVSVKLVSGYEVWTGMESVFRPMETRTVRTGEDGIVAAQFTPNRGGSFVVRAEAADAQGRVAKAEAHCYAYSGAVEETSGRESALSLQLDKRKYEEGETARALVRSDKPGGAVLLTIEGEDVYSARVVRMNSRSAVIPIPVTAQLRPNAFVGVCSVRSKRFESRIRRLGVDLSAKRIQVSVEADKKTCAPGSAVTYTVRTTDDAGRPLPSEVSLGVVDEAIYALAEDSTDLLRAFYPKRYNGVETDYSFEEIYLDGGDKAPTNIQIRSRFKDTAFWRASVLTDSAGTASVTVQLPDNLTEWRATVQAVSAATHVGSGTSSVRARKDLMVRLQTPAYLVQKDTQRLLAMVTNDSGREAEVNVQLEAQGIQVKGNLRQSVRVPHGSTKQVEWTLEAPLSGSATLTAKAWIASGASDGERKTIEIQPHGRMFVEAEAGEVVGAQGSASKEIRLNVRQGAAPNVGGLVVTVSPTLAGPLIQSLDDLIGYPYGCVEQTLSRFLPTVVVSKTFEEFGLPKPPVMAEAPQMAAEGLARLKKMQHADGGWGWWEWDSSNLAMTAMVLDGLLLAKDSGFEANGFMVRNAVKWVVSQMQLPLPAEKDWRYRDELSGRIYAAYVLARFGAKEPVLRAFEKIDPSALGPYDSAQLALAYHALGGQYAGHRDAALNRAVGAAEKTAATAHWPERYWGHETTARCLLALATIRPSDPLIPKAVRFLMNSRTGDLWTSTRDTSYVILALNSYWRSTRELSPEGEIAVSLNGSELRRVQVSTRSLFSPDLRIELPLSALRPGANTLKLTRTGDGRSYYSAELRQTVIQDELGPLVGGPGLAVERRFRVMAAERQEDGSLRMLPGKRSVEQADRGDILRCEVTVRSQSDMHFVMVEVPVPANCRVTEREDLDEYQEWNLPWDKHVIRDDRVSFFLRRMPKGEHTFLFAFQAESPGKAHALPAVVYNMYDPSARSSSAETPFEVRR